MFSFTQDGLIKAYWKNELSCVEIAKEKGFLSLTNPIIKGAEEWRG